MQPHIPSQFSRCTQIFSRKVMWVEKASSTNIEFQNLKVLSNFCDLSNKLFWQLCNYILICLFTFDHCYQTLSYSATMPHFFGNILGKNKIILENGWSNSVFFRPHLKNCYCDKRYLGKWVGDPLKIVQNESVTKKNTCWSTL